MLLQLACEVWQLNFGCPPLSYSGYIGLELLRDLIPFVFT